MAQINPLGIGNQQQWEVFYVRYLWLYNLQIGNSGEGICAAGVDMFFCWGQNVPTFNDVFLSL